MPSLPFPDAARTREFPEDPASSLGPTRSSELERLVAALAEGRSVLVVSYVADGSSVLASALAHRLGAKVFRCTPFTRASDIDAALGDAPPGAPSPAGAVGTAVVFDSTHVLPAEAIHALERGLHHGTAPLAVFADGDRLQATGPESALPLAGLVAAWRREEIERLDLQPLPLTETLDTIRATPGSQALDALQIHTLAELAEGMPLLAADLTDEAINAPDRAPRRVPRPGIDPTAFGSKSLLRLGDRYTQLPQDLAVAAGRIHRYGPLHLSVASRLFGTEVIGQLVALRIARHVDEDGDPMVSVSALHAGGLAVHRFRPDDEEHVFRSYLATLVSNGYVASDATVLALAHAALEAPEISMERHLMERAATIAARLGSATEALAFLRAATDDAGEYTVLGACLSIRAQLMEGRADGALSLAHATWDRLTAGALSPVTSAEELELLYHSALAVSWVSSTPAWWGTLLGDAAAGRGHAAVVLNAWIGDLDGRAALAELLDVAGNADAALPLRLLALAYALVAQADEGDTEGLTLSLESAGRLLWRARGSADPESGFLLDEARMLLHLSVGAVRIVCGLGVAEVPPSLSGMATEAVGDSRHVGWFRSSMLGGLNALAAFAAGSVEGTRVNVDGALQSLRPATFPVTATLLSALALTVHRLDASLAPDSTWIGTHFTARDRLRPALASVFKPLVEPEVGPNPGDDRAPIWAGVYRRLDDVMAGRLHPSAALSSLTQRELECTLPAVAARVGLLRALVSREPEALFEAGEALGVVGAQGAALHAYSYAKAQFLARRALTRAGDTTNAIAALLAHEAPSLAVPELVSAPPANLTERELEVCELVAEGLTNVQIARRLFLSVRTVESHVLQARAKLGAARRRDIPALLLMAKRQGLLAQQPGAQARKPR